MITGFKLLTRSSIEIYTVLWANFKFPIPYFFIILDHKYFDVMMGLNLGNNYLRSSVNLRNLPALPVGRRFRQFKKHPRLFREGSVLKS